MSKPPVFSVLLCLSVVFLLAAAQSCSDHDHPNGK